MQTGSYTDIYIITMCSMKYSKRVIVIPNLYYKTTKIGVPIRIEV